MTRVSVAVPAIAALLIALVPGLANAQFPEAVQSGMRIRVWVPEPYMQEQGPWRRQQLRGTVASVTLDTLHLSVPGTEGTLAVARQSIRRLDVSRGRPSRVASAVERAFAGAIVGAITVVLDNDPRGSEWPHYSREWRAAEEGAKWGAAFGAAFGFFLPTERWRRVRLSR
ncbi:MAG: hypothetical protein ACREOK_12820 [Gemmatimonadaceae bacterium]